MTYQVLARKWRPQQFDDVLGQQHVTDVLKNMLTTGRLHHGYLFSGTRGIGKTTTARILAKSLNCVNGPAPEPCNQCEFCREITEGYSIDVEEIDGASNRGVDDVRILQDNASYAPSRSRYKVFIIDEVHMLTTEAFNALLKTMEEPPANVVFILATTEPWKVPITILSRCQQFKFQQASSEDLLELLRKIVQHEGITISDDSLNVIIKTAGGSVRDAENLLDQVIGFSGGVIQDQDVRHVLGIPDSQLLHDVFMALFQRQTSRVFQVMEQLINQSYDLRLFCMELMERLRNMIVLKIARHPEPYLALFDYNQAELERYAIHATLSELQQWFWLISEAERQIKFSPHPRFLLEMALAKMAQVQALEPLEDLDEQLDTLQSLLANVQEEVQESSTKPSSSFQEPVARKPTPILRHSPTSSPDMSNSISLLQRSYAAPSQELTRTWNTVLDVIKHKRRGLAAALRHAVLLELTHDALTLGFHPDTSFARSQLEDQDKVTIIRDAVREHLGYDVQVRTTLYDGAVSTESMQEKLAQQPASQPMPEMPTQPYTPPGSSQTQKQSEGTKTGRKSEWKAENTGEWKDRNGKKSSQYKAPVQVSPQDIARMFEGEIEE